MPVDSAHPQIIDFDGRERGVPNVVPLRNTSHGQAVATFEPLADTAVPASDTDIEVATTRNNSDSKTFSLSKGAIVAARPGNIRVDYGLTMGFPSGATDPDDARYDFWIETRASGGAWAEVSGSRRSL